MAAHEYASHDSWYAKLEIVAFSDITGDIVVTAKTGFDFVKGGELFIGSNKGGHGSIARDTMLVPYVITGPGVAHGRLTTARAEDVGQTLIKLMDATVNAQAVGQVLTEALQ